MMFIENTFFNMSTYGTAINALIVKYSSQLFKYICMCINSLHYKTGFMSISKANSLKTKFRFYTFGMYVSVFESFFVSLFSVVPLYVYKIRILFIFITKTFQSCIISTYVKYQSEYILFIEMKHSHLEICIVEK